MLYRITIILKVFITRVCRLPITLPHILITVISTIRHINSHLLSSKCVEHMCVKLRYPQNELLSPSPTHLSHAITHKPINDHERVSQPNNSTNLDYTKAADYSYPEPSPSCTPAMTNNSLPILPDSEECEARGQAASSRTSDSNHVRPVLPPYPVLPASDLTTHVQTSRYLER